jgi:hypothetical protein
MGKMGCDQLTPGMVLAKPLIGKNGMVILGEGAELTEKWIDRIRDMGIDGVFVGGHSEPAMPLDEALSRLEERFETVQDKPYMALIKKIVRTHIERQYE